jgi:putative oxidoreductase
MASENKIRRIAVWVVSVLLTVVFLMAGAMKLLGKAAGMFEHWGYPAWFSYAVGAVEVVSAALLLIPKAASLGGAALAVVMAGAIFTHIRSNEWNHVPGVVVLLVLAAIIAYARREQLLGASSGAASDLKPPL